MLPSFLHLAPAQIHDAPCQPQELQLQGAAVQGPGLSWRPQVFPTHLGAQAAGSSCIACWAWQGAAAVGGRFSLSPSASYCHPHSHVPCQQEAGAGRENLTACPCHCPSHCTGPAAPHKPQIEQVLEPILPKPGSVWDTGSNRWVHPSYTCSLPGPPGCPMSAQGLQKYLSGLTVAPCTPIAAVEWFAFPVSSLHYCSLTTKLSAGSSAQKAKF